MQITQSYDDPAVVPPAVRDKYEWIETGNCAAILSATSHEEWVDIVGVLDSFRLHPDTWLQAGGNKGDLTADLDERFRPLGWRETRIDIETKGYLFTDFQMVSRDYVPRAKAEVPTIYSEGYRVDNHKGRVIVDIEWNAKDGNLDRDLAAYRSWYEAGLINGAVIITKDRRPLLELARDLRNMAEIAAGLRPTRRAAALPIDLGTSTTTSFDKAQIRVKRGGAGTCPVLIVAVSPKTWDHTPWHLPGDDAAPA